MTDSEWLERLLADPTGEDVLVFADQLEARGDRRGEHIALCHAAIAGDTPESRHRASARLATFMETYSDAVIGRATGFPFVDPSRWRRFVEFRGTGQTRLRGRPGLPMFRRLRAFFEERTDCRGANVVATSAIDPGPWVRALGDPMPSVPGDLPSEVRLCWRLDPGAPLAALDALLATPTGSGDHPLEAPTILLQFSFAFAERGWPLPFTEDGHYERRSRWGTAESVIWIDIGSGDPGKLALRLFFPFEQRSDESFAELWAACRRHLSSALHAKSGLREVGAL